VPSGATVNGNILAQNSAGGVQDQILTANTLTVALGTTGINGAGAQMHFTVQNGSTPGNIQIAFCSATSSQLSEVGGSGQSYIVARRSVMV
jgi:hypothetical protein